MTFKKLLTITLASVAVLSACQLPDKPVSQKEALDLAHRIETSVKDQNSAVLDNLFDERQFSKRVLAEAHARFNLSLAAEARNAVPAMKWGQKILDAVGNGGSYQLVHQYEKDGHQHLLFRLFNYNSAINYHDYDLYKNDKTVKVRDAFIYMSGEDLSKTMAESLVMVSDRIDGMSKEEQDKLARVKQINRFLEGGNPEEAEEIYGDVPADMQKQRVFQLIHVRIASKLGDSSYLAALQEYKNNFPQDPNLYFLMIDAYILQKDFSGALNSVNHLDSILRIDPFLDYYRGLIYEGMNDPIQSRLAFERLHAHLPKFGKGTVQLLDSYVHAGCSDSAAMLVKEAEQLNHLSAEQIETLEKTYPTIKPYLK